jgi:hypothetical protein
VLPSHDNRPRRLKPIATASLRRVNQSSLRGLSPRPRLARETVRLVQQYTQRRISKNTLQRGRQETTAKLAKVEQQLQYVETEIQIQQCALQQEQD